MNKPANASSLDQKIATFLSELNDLMQIHQILIHGNAGVNIRKLPEGFKGYMAAKWINGNGYDLKEINRTLVYPDHSKLSA